MLKSAKSSNFYKRKKGQYCSPKLKITIILIYIFHLAASSCQLQNALTTEQNLELAQFVTADKIAYAEQDNLREAYKTITRKMENYLIQIQDSYQFDVNDIQLCENFPEYLTFNSLDDAWICMRNQVAILNCNKQWELKIGCGTFIELHRPFGLQVLDTQYLDQLEITDAFNIPLVEVCAGTYHLWFIYSTRVGKIIKNVKPIFVSYPSCQC